MDFEALFRLILSKPDRYPGLHQESQPRTKLTQKSLEPLDQMQLVWTVTVEYIANKLRSGYNVNFRGLGAFSFDIDTALPSLGRLDIREDFEDQRLTRKHIHTIKPVFLPDVNIKKFLTCIGEKDIVDKAACQSSVYEKGFSMISCNPNSIAIATCLKRPAVAAIHGAICKAIQDCTQKCLEMKLNFGFCIINIKASRVKTKFSQSFIAHINDRSFESRLKKTEGSTAAIWNSKETTEETKYQEIVRDSLQENEVKQMSKKTLALKCFSMDMSGTKKKNQK